MRFHRERPLRKLILCLAATLLSTQAFAATYEMRVLSKGLVSPLTNPIIAPVAPWSVEFGTPAFRIPTPQSNSTGVFSYSTTTPGTLSVNGDVVSVVGVGSGSITATQAGDSQHNPGSIQISLEVVGAVPTLGPFSNIARTYGSGNFVLAAPTSNSTGSFSYTSSNSAVAQVSGDATVNLLGAGTTTITATQYAAGNYVGASTTAVLTVSKATPELNAWTIPTKITTDSAFTLSGPTSTSNGAFSYTSSNPAVATVSGSTVTLKGIAGSTTITADQASTANFAAAAATTTLTVTTPPLPAGYTSHGGLTWTPKQGANTFSGSAPAFCSNATFMGVTGWRLPTVAELLSFRTSGKLAVGGWTYEWAFSNTSTGTDRRTIVNLDSGLVYDSPAVNSKAVCVR